MTAVKVNSDNEEEDLYPAMYVESHYESPEAGYLDRGKLLENLLTISNSGTPVIQERTEYPCPLCRGTFRALGDLVVHECPKERPNRPLLTCCFCAFATDMAIVFRDHLKLHTNPSLRCGHCNNSFSSESVLLKHLQLHGNSLPLEPFSLGLLPAALTGSLQMSPLTVANGGACMVNSRTYVVPVPENQHSKYTCGLCNANFPQVSALAAHGLKHPEFPDVYIQENMLLPGRGTQEPLGALMCSQCCFVFTHPVALAAHHCSHSTVVAGSNGDVGSGGGEPSSPVRLYCCPYCPYTSYLLASLQRHKEVHFSHRCTDCGVRFLTPAALAEHRVKLHPGIPQGAPPVSVAPPLNNVAARKRGRPRIRDDNPPSRPVESFKPSLAGRKWQCKTCGISLRSCEDVVSHQCKAYECPHCNFMTHKPNGLSIHITFAHSFKCKTCGNAFATKEQQTLHSTYLCPNRLFKHVGEEDIPLAVLRRHSTVPPIPRRRGRPPKDRSQEANKVACQGQVEPKDVSRKRGRPRGRRKQTA